MDSLVFEQSIATEVSSSEFVDKQWLYVVDNNNGSYASQVVLDTTPLSNSGAYINWSEAFILMPLVLQLRRDTGAAMGAGAAGFDSILGLKSGFWNMLHSLTCEFNNGNIIQQIPFLNVFCSFKNLTSWSLDDVINWGDICGFHKDSAHSWCYSDVAAAANVGNLSQSGGVGLSNNRNAPYVDITLLQSNVGGAGAVTDVGSLAVNTSTHATLSSNSVRMYWNKGLWSRQKSINATGVGGATSQKHSSFLSEANMNSIFKAYVKSDVADNRSIAIDAIIRLKDVADFFCKCPLLKGSTMRIFLSTNQSSMTYTATSGTTAAGATVGGNVPVTEATYAQLGLSTNPVILGGGGTNPVQVASADLGQGASVLCPLPAAVGAAAVPATGGVAVSIVRTQFTGFNEYAAPYSSCRLYAPAYTFNPIAEQRYLSLAPTKKIIYNDIFQYSFNGQVANSPFNLLVSNGIPNVRGVLVMPMIPNGSNGVAAAGQVRTSTLLSPFCSTGGSPDPIALTNFQIQVSGKNLFLNQQQYDYEQFAEQLVSSNQLNGSLTTSMGSGLISKSDFQSLYRYYYGNCSRSLPSEDGVAKAIQISGTFVSPQNISLDLMVFVEFEREIVVDVRTGARVA